MVQERLIPPLLPANIQRRVAVLHVPLVLLLTSGLTRIRARKRGTRVLMRLQLLQQRRLILHRYGAHGSKQQKRLARRQPRGRQLQTSRKRDELSQRSTVPTKGRAPADKIPLTSDPAAKTAKQRAQAISKLDHLIGGVVRHPRRIMQRTRSQFLLRMRSHPR